MYLRMPWIQRTLSWLQHLPSRINHLPHSWIHSFILPSVFTPGILLCWTDQASHRLHILSQRWHKTLTLAKGETGGTHPTERIPVAAIDQIPHGLQDKPDCSISEPSNARAIRLVAPRSSRCGSRAIP
jgi:hypothetical protein